MRCSPLSVIHNAQAQTELMPRQGAGPMQFALRAQTELMHAGRRPNAICTASIAILAAGISCGDYFFPPSPVGQNVRVDRTHGLTCRLATSVRIWDRTRWLTYRLATSVRIWDRTRWLTDQLGTSVHLVSLHCGPITRQPAFLRQRSISRYARSISMIYMLTYALCQGD